MSDLPKTLYCDNCRIYPDLIECSNTTMVHKRWNGTIYEVVSVGEPEDDGMPICQVCGSILEEKC